MPMNGTIAKRMNEIINKGITNFLNVNKVLCNLISNDYESRYELEDIISVLSK